MAKNINIRSFTNRVTFGSMQVPYGENVFLFFVLPAIEK